MAIAVKSFLNFEGGNPEIRRFSVPEDVGANFGYLVEKIQRTYPQLLRQEFKLFWQDADNDFIRFTTDKELVEALGNIQSNFFKVFIKFTPAAQQDGSEPPKHAGVTCDVCNNSIVGTRFKCLICPDYDLCGHCEEKGFHPEHEMLRIRTPKPHPFEGLWKVLGGRRGRCGRHRGGPSMRPPRRGHHGPFGNHGPFGHPGPFGPFGNPRYNRHPGPNGHPPPFVPPFGPRAHQGAWGGCGASWAPPKEDNGSNNKADTSENQDESVPPFFNAMGDMIANFLEPFGIDVETYVDNPDEPCQCGDEPAKNGDEPTKNGDEPTKNGDSDRSTVPSENPTGATSQMADKQDLTETPKEVIADGNQDSPMAQGDGFVVVNKASETPKDQQNEQTRPYARVQEELFQKRLEEAIKQMHDMGFNNEGGWMTQLLISKDCDITRVLDTLHSQAK